MEVGQAGMVDGRLGCDLLSGWLLIFFKPDKARLALRGASGWWC